MENIAVIIKNQKQLTEVAPSIEVTYEYMESLTDGDKQKIVFCVTPSGGWGLQKDLEADGRDIITFEEFMKTKKAK